MSGKGELFRASRLCAPVALAMLLGAAGSARAQAVGPEVEKLYNRAVADMAAKRYAEACPKLEEVTRQVPDGLGAKITLGECYEAEGKLGSAHAQYVLVLRAATSSGNAERGKEANKKIAALLPRVARITLNVPEESRKMAGFVVTIDGVIALPGQWSEGLAVDTGTHLIQASASGRRPWSNQVQVPGDNARIAVEVPKMTDQEVLPPPPAPRVAWRFAGGVAALGLGGISLALGVVSSVQVSEAQSKIEPYRAKLLPGEHLCEATSQAPLAVSDACGKQVFGPLQFVFYGAGAVMGGVGLYLLATSQVKEPAQKLSWALSPSIGPGYGGVSAVGKW